MEALEKSGEAISHLGVGQKSSGRVRCVQTDGVLGVWHQRVVLPLRAHPRRRERRGGQWLMRFTDSPTAAGELTCVSCFYATSGASNGIKSASTLCTKSSKSTCGSRLEGTWCATSLRCSLCETEAIWPWADAHQSSDLSCLRNVSNFEIPAKGDFFTNIHFDKIRPCQF